MNRVGACGRVYDPAKPECREVPLIGSNGLPNGFTRCSDRWRCIEEKGKR